MPSRGGASYGRGGLTRANAEPRCSQAVVGGPSDGVTRKNSDLRKQEARARGSVRMAACVFE
jgi:hypothetical protein